MKNLLDELKEYGKLDNMQKFWHDDLDKQYDTVKTKIKQIMVLNYIQALQLLHTFELTAIIYERSNSLFSKLYDLLKTQNTFYFGSVLRAVSGKWYSRIFCRIAVADRYYTLTKVSSHLTSFHSLKF